MSRASFGITPPESIRHKAHVIGHHDIRDDLVALVCYCSCGLAFAEWWDWQFHPGPDACVGDEVSCPRCDPEGARRDNLWARPEWDRPWWAPDTEPAVDAPPG